jgi:hypothetical protein
MRSIRQVLVATAVVAILGSFAGVAEAITTGYVGTDYDIGGNFYPGDGPADVTPYFVVPWRDSGTAKAYDADGNNVYGTAGYYLFGTRFDYPNRNATPGNAFVNPTDNSVYPNITATPSFVAGTQILVGRKAGGWNYSVIDDPRVTNGVRDMNWGLSQTPPSTNQPAYVKLGFLDGDDALPATGDLASATGVGRWGFAVGASVPASFRVGVMTDGGDNAAFAPNEVLLAQVDSVTLAPISIVSSGTVVTSRYGVDMHFFDITGALPGDTFAFLVRNTQANNFGNAGVAGFTFDVTPEPGSMLLLGLLGVAGLMRRRFRSC